MSMRSKRSLWAGQKRPMPHTDKWVLGLPRVKELIRTGQEDRWVFEIPMFQDFIRVGYEERVEIAHQDNLTFCRWAVVQLVKHNFPALSGRARGQTNLIKDLDLLVDIAKKFIEATSFEEAEQALLSWRVDPTIVQRES